MIEIGILLGIVFLVFVFFYKQKAQEFRISQIEHTQLQTLPDLFTELNPIVIRGLPPSTFLTPDTIKKNSRIQNFPVGSDGLTIEKWLTSESIQLSIQPAELRTTLASELGIPMWAQHTWFEPLTAETIYSFAMNLEAEAWLTNMGMTKTLAATTLLYPTNGEYICSLMLDTSTQYLPRWEGRFLDEYTAADTPLLNKVQFIDIKLRPGHALLIPPHWIISMKATGNVSKPMFAFIELHHPLSRLAKALA
jgi:hypothetical protein